MTEIETESKSSDGDTAAAIGLGVAGLLAVFALPVIVANLRPSQPKVSSTQQFQKLTREAYIEANANGNFAAGGQYDPTFDSERYRTRPFVAGDYGLDYGGVTGVESSPMDQFLRLRAERPARDALAQQLYEKEWNRLQLYRQSRIGTYPAASLQSPREATAVHDAWSLPSVPLRPRPAETSQLEPASY